MSSAPLPLEPAPIAFGTDGWRGILGVDITIERLLPVAAAAAAELAHSAPPELASQTVVIGYDRRFLAPELAAALAAAVRGVGLGPLLAQEPLPTPACSWVALRCSLVDKHRQQLGCFLCKWRTGHKERGCKG